MTTWHQVRRILAGAMAAIVAALAQRRGIPLVWAVVMGVCGAIITASVLFPLLWRPRRAEPDAPSDGPGDSGKKGARRRGGR